MAYRLVRTKDLRESRELILVALAAQRTLEETLQLGLH